MRIWHLGTYRKRWYSGGPYRTVTGFIETQTTCSTVLHTAVNLVKFIQLGVFVGQPSDWRFNELLTRRVNVIISYSYARAYMNECQRNLFLAGCIVSLIVKCERYVIVCLSTVTAVLLRTRHVVKILFQIFYSDWGNELRFANFYARILVCSFHQIAAGTTGATPWCNVSVACAFSVGHFAGFCEKLCWVWRLFTTVRFPSFLEAR
jgi:hypothetical protein